MVRVTEARQMERMAVDESGKTSNIRTRRALKGQTKESEGDQAGNNTVWFTVLKSSLCL